MSVCFYFRTAQHLGSPKSIACLIPEMNGEFEVTPSSKFIFLDYKVGNSEFFIRAMNRNSSIKFKKINKTKTKIVTHCSVKAELQAREWGNSNPILAIRECAVV